MRNILASKLPFIFASQGGQKSEIERVNDSRDAELFLHFLERNPFGLRVNEEYDQELNDGHYRKKDKGIAAGFCRKRRESE